MSAVLRPPIRREVEALFAAEDLSRQARRLLIAGAQPAGEVEVFAATTLIDDAIARLVAARALLNSPETPSQGASS